MSETGDYDLAWMHGMPVEVISTGSIRLDAGLQVGGIPRGQMIEICGGLDSGKSALCYSILKQAQLVGGRVALIDADQSFNSYHIRDWELIAHNLYLSRLTCAEAVLDTVSILAKSAAFSVIAIDSLNSLVPEVTLNSQPGYYENGDLMALLASWLPRITRDLIRTETTLIITQSEQNHLSEIYHDLEKHLNRLTLALHASQRLKLTNKIEKPDLSPYRKIQVNVIKNNFAPCFKMVSLDIIVNRNINKIDELIDLAQERGLINQVENSYVYRGLTLGTNRNSAVGFLTCHPIIAREIESIIRKGLLL